MDYKIIKKLAQKIWDYHKMNQGVKKSDAILVLGSHDTVVAERGAELYLKGFAPKIIFSGGFGTYTKDLWSEPEADKFAKIAEKMGVPKEDILVENKSTNTGENILFTQKLLRDNNIDIKSVILVQKPYMERRTYATFVKQWVGGLKFSVTSPQKDFDEYLEGNNFCDFNKLVDIMVGDLQRIKVYPKEGFHIEQEIPNDVWEAYKKLVELGFTSHLI